MAAALDFIRSPGSRRKFMAVSLIRVRFPIFPWLHTPLTTNLRFAIPKEPLRIILRRVSTLSSVEPLGTAAAAEVATPSNTAQKWEPFRKKKVVMRVGYIGSDYRGLILNTHYICFHFCFSFAGFAAVVCLIFLFEFGAGLQIQRDEHELSSKILFPCPVFPINYFHFCEIVV